nr:hypothetical protein CFP56_19299 [Quercus suber]
MHVRHLSIAVAFRISPGREKSLQRKERQGIQLKSRNCRAEKPEHVSRSSRGKISREIWPPLSMTAGSAYPFDRGASTWCEMNGAQCGFVTLHCDIVAELNGDLHHAYVPNFVVKILWNVDLIGLEAVDAIFFDSELRVPRTLGIAAKAGVLRQSRLQSLYVHTAAEAFDCDIVAELNGDLHHAYVPNFVVKILWNVDLIGLEAVDAIFFDSELRVPRTLGIAAKAGVLRQSRLQSLYVHTAAEAVSHVCSSAMSR